MDRVLFDGEFDLDAASIQVMQRHLHQIRSLVVRNNWERPEAEGFTEFLITSMAPRLRSLGLYQYLKSSLDLPQLEHLVFESYYDWNPIERLPRLKRLACANINDLLLWRGWLVIYIVFRARWSLRMTYMRTIMAR